MSLWVDPAELRPRPQFLGVETPGIPIVIILQVRIRIPDTKHSPKVQNIIHRLSKKSTTGKITTAKNRI